MKKKLTFFGGLGFSSGGGGCWAFRRGGGGSLVRVRFTSMFDIIQVSFWQLILTGARTLLLG